MTPVDLARIHAAAFDGTRAWSAAEFASLLAQPGAILAPHGPAFALGRVTLDEAEVLSLACDPAHQRQGHARRALADLESRAATQGVTRIFLEVAEDNVAARALYARAGYGQSGRRPGYYRTNAGHTVAALILSRPLATP